MIHHLRAIASLCRPTRLIRMIWTKLTVKAGRQKAGFFKSVQRSVYIRLQISKPFYEVGMPAEEFLLSLCSVCLTHRVVQSREHHRYSIGFSGLRILDLPFILVCKWWMLTLFELQMSPFHLHWIPQCNTVVGQRSPPSLHLFHSYLCTTAKALYTNTSIAEHIIETNTWLRFYNDRLLGILPGSGEYNKLVSMNARNESSHPAWDSSDIERYFLTPILPSRYGSNRQRTPGHRILDLTGHGGNHNPFVVLQQSINLRKSLLWTHKSLLTANVWTQAAKTITTQPCQALGYIRDVISSSTLI